MPATTVMCMTSASFTPARLYTISVAGLAVVAYYAPSTPTALFAALLAAVIGVTGETVVAKRTAEAEASVPPDAQWALAATYAELEETRAAKDAVNQTAEARGVTVEYLAETLDHAQDQLAAAREATSESTQSTIDGLRARVHELTIERNVLQGQVSA